MLVSTATKGDWMTLVESNSPPMPTSRLTTSQWWRLKYSMAMQVTNSNSVG